MYEAIRSTDIPSEVFDLKKGEVMGAMGLYDYFYIYQMEDILPSQTKDYETAKEEIKNHFLNRKKWERYNAFIKELKEKANIKIYNEILSQEEGGQGPQK